MLMLATVRIGAIHSVVFAGFGEHALADRVSASGSRLVFTADITYRRGKDVPLKGIVDEAMDNAGPGVEHVIVLQRAAEEPAMTPGRDLTLGRSSSAGATATSGGYVEMEANEPAFILATSGTTAKPKLAVHTHGGYQVHITAMARWCYGLKPGEVWWSGSDIGWIVGHSYIVYAPLLVGLHHARVRGRARLPDLRRQLARRDRGARRHRHLHVAHGGAPAHALRRGGARLGGPLAPRARRSAPARCSTRPAWDWLQNTVLRQPRAGHRPHVADRDRRPGLRQPVRPGHAADQARLGGHPDARASRPRS